MTTSGTAFLPPRLPATLVHRPALGSRLGPDTGASWTLVVGPPGAGKTTLVRSWLHERPEPWTWIGITAAPYRRTGVVDLVVRGVQRARSGRPLDTFDALDMDTGGGPAILTQLVDELSSDPPGTPTALIVLDDAHLLHADEWTLVHWLLVHLPDTLHVVIVSRSDPPIPISRERASERMTEVRARDLAFDLDDTTQLLAATSRETAPTVAAMLQTRTEGWAAGVRLASLAIRDGANPDGLLERLASSNTSVAEFLLEEVLERLPADRRTFLEATANLSILEPQICDAVTGRSDSSEVLRGLATDGLFVSPIEQSDGHYRFHPLLAELLHYEQLTKDPEAARMHQLRAAEWLVANDRAIEAIEYFLGAGEHARAHRLVLDFFRPLYVGTHRRDLDRWLVAIPDEVIAESLERAVDHCAALALIGNPEGARWWVYCQGRDPTNDPWIASRLDGVLAIFDAVRAMRDDMHLHWEESKAKRPADRIDPSDEVVATWVVRLEAQLGDPEIAVAVGRDLLSSPRELIPEASALSVLAGAIDATGDHESALALAQRSIARWREDGEPELPGMLDALVVAACAARRAGDFDSATEYVESAIALPPRRLGPHLLISIGYIERARIDHARGGSAWRTELLGLADELRVGGAPAEVAAWVDRARLDMECAVDPGPAPPAPPERPMVDQGPIGLVEELTDRELTILQFLASHLSFPEIGQELYISRHTVKSHVSRIYRKLGTSSRSEAIREARRLGLLSAA